MAVKHTEELIHREAFLFYYELGAKGGERHYKPVADKFERSERTIKRWAKWFGWKGRVAVKDRAIAKRVEDKLDEDLVQVKANYIAIVDTAISNCVGKRLEYVRDSDGHILSGKNGHPLLKEVEDPDGVLITPRSGFELDRLIRTGMYLRDEPDSRPDPAAEPGTMTNIQRVLEDATPEEREEIIGCLRKLKSLIPSG